MNLNLLKNKPYLEKRIRLFLCYYITSTWLLKTIIFISFSSACLESCHNDNLQVSHQESNEYSQPKQRIFGVYLHDVFRKDSIATGYYAILGKKICVQCKKEVQNSFQSQFNQISKSSIVLITDFEYNSEFLNTLNTKCFILIDSFSVFEKYNFPKSFLTYYKVVDGMIVDYVFFSNDREVDTFLKEAKRNTK